MPKQSASDETKKGQKFLQQTKPVPEGEWEMFHILHLLTPGQIKKSTLGSPGHRGTSSLRGFLKEL